MFVEPQAIVELNNNLRDLELKEEDEIRRILDRLSRFVEGFDLEILENQKILSRIDFLSAKVKYALQNEHTRPNITDKKNHQFKRSSPPFAEGKSCTY